MIFEPSNFVVQHLLIKPVANRPKRQSPTVVQCCVHNHPDTRKDLEPQKKVGVV